MRISLLFIALLFINFSTQGQSLKAVEPVFEGLSKFPNVRDFAMTSTGEEAFITIQSPLGEFAVLAQVKKVNNRWAEPEIMPFSGKYSDLEPFVSTNDLRLYFASNRPLTDSIGQSKDFDIWYVERENTEAPWGSPINIGEPINTEHDEFYPSLADNNNLYFTSGRPGTKGKDDILFSIWNNNEYSMPISVSDSINTESDEFNAFIAPDESYLIFGGYNREDGHGRGDLYISFRDEALGWSAAVNLGEDINSKDTEYCPFVDSQSNTLYFTGRRNSIKALNNFQTMDEVLEEVNKSENGMSRIYKVFFDKDELILTKK